MYEIWLMLNIVWEIALDLWPALLVGAAIWLALAVAAARACSACLRTGLPLALAAGLVATAAAFVIVPAAVGSSLGEMGYWVDWLTLAGIAGGFGVLAALITLPVVAIRRRPNC
ncbi:MAG TPA: hypothetical protein VGE12_00830 [Noviherbaspirillum sp.]